MTSARSWHMYNNFPTTVLYIARLSPSSSTSDAVVGVLFTLCEGGVDVVGVVTPLVRGGAQVLHGDQFVELSVLLEVHEKEEVEEDGEGQIEVEGEDELKEKRSCITLNVDEMKLKNTLSHEVHVTRHQKKDENRALSEHAHKLCNLRVSVFVSLYLLLMWFV